MIAYKVISYERESAVVNEAEHRQAGFTLKYAKGSTVKAKKETIGIWCYRDKESAQDYADGWGGFVITVRSIGKEIKPKAISNCFPVKQILSYYRRCKKFRTTKKLLDWYSRPRKEYVFYSEVKVLN